MGRQATVPFSSLIYSTDIALRWHFRFGMYCVLQARESVERSGLLAW
jgi:hypothetical protein